MGLYGEGEALVFKKTEDIIHLVIERPLPTTARKGRTWATTDGGVARLSSDQDSSSNDLPSLKLYWLKTSAPEENCFVVARTKRAAEREGDEIADVDPGDTNAQLVMTLDPEWVSRVSGHSASSISLSDAHYIDPEHLTELGITWSVQEGDIVFRYGRRRFRQQGFENFASELMEPTETVLIKSVRDLLHILDRQPKRFSLFRGQSSGRWKLQCGIQRLVTSGELSPSTLRHTEVSLLNEFKRRARQFLPNAPTSQWEWLILAQHFGLPTRLLDWTENPLIALYFAVYDSQLWPEDGILYAYRHRAPELDITSPIDPFTIERIELVRPPHIDQRIIVQRSVFTAEPSGPGAQSSQSAGLSQWYVTYRNKESIKRELALLGISDSTLFPGLDSLAADIRANMSLHVVQSPLSTSSKTNEGKS